MEIACHLPHQFEHVKRLLTTCQIFMFLLTSLLPEGRMVAWCAPADGSQCGCSHDARQSGTCCCSRRQTNSNSGNCCRAKRTGTSGTEQRKRDKPTTDVRCKLQRLPDNVVPSPQSPSSCCAKRNSAPQSEPAAESIAVTCPCGGDTADMLILHAPRTTVPLSAVAGLPEVSMYSGPGSDRCLSLSHPPHVRPPKSLSC